MILTLYVNDPMGSRCRINLESAMKIKAEYPIELRVVKHGSEEYHKEANPPQCPSIKLDDRIIKEFGVMSFEEIETEMLRSLY